MAKETLNPIIIQATQVPRTFKGTLRKNFLRIRSCGEPTKEWRLEFLNNAYFRLLKNIKQLFIDHTDPWERTFYEKDRKGDRTCCEAMHDFVTTSFYFHIYCEFDKLVWIDYAFNDCPIEKEIRELFLKDGYQDCMREQSSLNVIRIYTVKTTDDPKYVDVLENECYSS